MKEIVIRIDKEAIMKWVNPISWIATIASAALSLFVAAMCMSMEGVPNILAFPCIIACIGTIRVGVYFYENAP